MEIIVMQAKDYEQVHALWMRTPGMGLNDRDDSFEGFERFLRRNPTTCFTAWEQEKIIGCILCGHDGRRGYIYHTAIDFNARRRGVATALVDAALSALEKEGIGKAALVVFDRNQIGNAFWEMYGFSARDDLVYRDHAMTDFKRVDT
ncbi:MAG: GNAT family N-acetyltransferase [Butyricicoccus sp.]|nr:GNAT family N-acetyltransferase [Butyricicoccus sp.]